MQSEEQIDLATFLLIAESQLQIRAQDLVAMTRVASAESALAAPFAGLADRLFYDDPAERAAIVCSRLIRNHPLPDANKRTAYLCMREQLHRAGLAWSPPSEDERVDTIERLASGDLPEAEFVAWVQAHTS